MVFEPISCPDCHQTDLTQPRKQANPQTQLSKSSVVPENLREMDFRPEASSIESDRRNPSEMRRIFLFTRSSGAVNRSIDTSLEGIQQLVIDRLKADGFTVLEVPKELKASEAVAWINQRGIQGDVALSIQTDSFFNPGARGVAAFYRSDSSQQQQHAQQLLQQLVSTVPNLISRGVKSDSETAFGQIAFTRQATVPAIVLTLGFKTSPLDRALILQSPQEIAQGIVGGLKAWSLATPIRRASPVINVNVNGNANNQQGVIVNGSAFIPIDSLSPLNVDLAKLSNVNRIRSGETTYIRAIDLREVGVAVRWLSDSRTVTLQATPRLSLERAKQIMGRGYLSQMNLTEFLKVVNPRALQRFPRIAELYLTESAIEGVSQDVAFAQALLETNFFRFSDSIRPSQNNFGGLSEVGSPKETAVFPNIRIGVRAHIQQLKAYSSLEPLAQDVVSPRFRFVLRGAAPNVELLSDRYSANPMYGEQILAIQKQLYRLAGLL